MDLPEWVRSDQLDGLKPQHREYVVHRASGLSQIKSLRATGYDNPNELTTRTAAARIDQKHKELIATLTEQRKAHHDANDPHIQEAYRALPTTLVHELKSRDSSVAVKIHRVLSGIRAGLRLDESLEQLDMTVSQWRHLEERFPGLGDQTLHAYEDGTHNLVQQTLEIADKAERTREGVQHARLQIETRFKLAELWNKAFYGKDRSETTSPPTLIFSANFMSNENER